MRGGALTSRPLEQTTVAASGIKELCVITEKHPVTLPFFSRRCHQQPIRAHLNRDIKRMRGHQWTTYGGSRCPHNMTPKHAGLHNALLINDYNIHSRTSNSFTHTNWKNWGWKGRQHAGFLLLDNHVFNGTDGDFVLLPKLLRCSQSYTSNAGRTGLSRLLEV